jgi:hypothetical protein
MMRRDGLGCGLLKDGSTGKSYVVAAGGFNGLIHLDSVEILDLENPDSWFGGPILPASLHNGRLVQVRISDLRFLGPIGSDLRFLVGTGVLGTVKNLPHRCTWRDNGVDDGKHNLKRPSLNYKPSVIKNS